jgi:hypothetical protein
MSGFLRRWRARRAGDPHERAAIDSLIERARALPRETEPERDLWLGVRNRIAAGEAGERAPAPIWRSRLSVPVWAAGAAALLLVATTIGTALWLGSPPSLDDPRAIRTLADSLRERDGMGAVRRDLLALVAERRAQLPPDVVAAVEKNLAEIDRAIAEIHLAFEAHPENSALHFLLAEAYQREAQMLEQLQWWTSTTVPEARS